MDMQKWGPEPDYHLLCMGCEHPIEHGQFFVEVRAYHQQDDDTKIAVHVGCLLERRLRAQND